jgi:hypothetical protein
MLLWRWLSTAAAFNLTKEKKRKTENRKEKRSISLDSAYRGVLIETQQLPVRYWLMLCFHFFRFSSRLANCIFITFHFESKQPRRRCCSLLLLCCSLVWLLFHSVRRTEKGTNVYFQLQLHAQSASKMKETRARSDDEQPRNKKHYTASYLAYHSPLKAIMKLNNFPFFVGLLRLRRNSMR